MSAVRLVSVRYVTQLALGAHIAVAGVRHADGDQELIFKRLEDVQTTAGGDIFWIKFAGEPSQPIHSDTLMLVL